MIATPAANSKIPPSWSESIRANVGYLPFLPVQGIIWWLFIILWIVGFLDVSRDLPVHWILRDQNDLDMPRSFREMSGGILSVENLIALQLPVDALSTIIIVLLSTLGVMTYLMGRSGYRPCPAEKTFLIFLTLSVFTGAAVGLIKGVPYTYVLGDARNLAIYPMLFAIREGMTGRGVGKLQKLFLIACMILTLKLLLFFLMGAYYGFVSWRSLFKQTIFFMPMLFIGLAGATLSQNKARYKYSLLALLAGFGIAAAASRAMFVGTLVGLVFLTFMLLNNKRVYRLLGMGFVVFIMMLVIGISLQDDPSKAFGRWSEDQPGVQGELNYRWRQADMLIQRFEHNWLVGTGMGYFDPESEFVLAYGPRPYLLELEFINLSAKLGLIGMIFWIIAFLSLFLACIRALRRTAEPRNRVFLLGLTAGFVSFMVASMFQVLYSSMYFHLYIVLLLLVLSALRDPELALPRAACEH